MKIISRLVAVILFVAFFFFALKNTQDVTLHFFMGYERTDPLVLIILISFLIGLILGILAMMPSLFRHRKTVSRQKRTIQTMQTELDALRRANNGTVSPAESDAVIPEAHLH